MAMHQKYKRLGLCVSCGKTNDTQKCFCSACTVKKKHHTRAYNDRCKALGVCQKCGRPNETPERAYCLPCRQKDVRSQTFRRKGLCRNCGQPPMLGETRCNDCIQNPQCLDCGKPRIPDESRCAECFERRRILHVAKVCRENANSKKEGKCVHCRKPNDNIPKSSCLSCTFKQTEARRQLKLECFIAYGGVRCCCCGTTIVEFLTIDHTNNDGKAHRKLLGATGGISLYRKLKKLGFPKSPPLSVMCFNCNISRSLFGCCPCRTIGKV